LPLPPPPAPIKIEVPKAEGVSVRKEFKAFFGEMDVTKVPEIYSGVRIKIVDEKAVNKLVKAGVREIPGIPIREEMSMTRKAQGSKEEEL
jgi:hypothetical protein